MTGKGGPGPSLSFVCPLASATGRAQNCGNMAMPIVATKLNLPVLRPCVVPRPRLSHLLDRRLETKLTLISAPAGLELSSPS